MQTSSDVIQVIKKETRVVVDRNRARVKTAGHLYIDSVFEQAFSLESGCEEGGARKSSEVFVGCKCTVGLPFLQKIKNLLAVSLHFSQLMPEWACFRGGCPEILKKRPDISISTAFSSRNFRWRVEEVKHLKHLWVIFCECSTFSLETSQGSALRLAL